MAQYHMNTGIGTVGTCAAAARCPFAPLKDHYPSPVEACRAHECKMEQNTFPAPAAKVQRLTALEALGWTEFYLLPS